MVARSTPDDQSSNPSTDFQGGHNFVANGVSSNENFDVCRKKFWGFLGLWVKQRAAE
jgi:hypothetical protein